MSEVRRSMYSDASIRVREKMLGKLTTSASKPTQAAKAKREKALRKADTK